MVANSLLPDPYPTPYPTPLTLWLWSKGQNFVEHGHVAYQIKENHECSNMVPNIQVACRPHGP